MTYQLVEATTDSPVGYEPRGGAKAMWGFKGPEGMLSGPAETGKTLACLHKLDACAWKYPRMQGNIVRLTYNSMPGTVLQTYIKKVLGAWDPDTRSINPERSPIRAYGGEKPQWFDYPNGSRLYVVGLDNPNKALSSERDMIYVNQAEELEPEQWEVLTTRATGRAGNMPYSQVIGDCNPGPPLHWIQVRKLAGALSLFESRHEDNPTLFDAYGNITAQGVRSLAALDALTGITKERLRYGRWVGAEGLVYDVWEDGPEDGNVTTAAEYVPDGGAIFWGVDDGYAGELDTSTGYYTAASHPRVFLLCQLRHDGTLCVFEESYRVKTLSDVHIDEVLKLPYPVPEYAAVDKSAAELRARLNTVGIYTRNGPASVEESIKEFHRRIAKDANGKRLVLVHPRCKHLRREMVTYARDAQTGKPIKAHDHGPDSGRYIAWTMRYD